jgi:hypothetical protein
MSELCLQVAVACTSLVYTHTPQFSAVHWEYLYFCMHFVTNTLAVYVHIPHFAVSLKILLLLGGAFIIFWVVFCCTFLIFLLHWSSVGSFLLVTVHFLLFSVYEWHTSIHVVESSWNVMAHADAREGKWRGNWQIEWVASTLHITSEHGVSSITTADAHNSAASN